jgi:hypothetical protein
MQMPFTRVTRIALSAMLLASMLSATTIDASITSDRVNPIREEFVIVEPDEFAVGTDISNLTPGVVLSAFGTQPDFGFPLFSNKIRTRAPRDSEAPVPTGDFVFGVDSDDFESSFFAGGHQFRADFLKLTDFVSIRVAPDNPVITDIALIQIFGRGGVLLDAFTTLGGSEEVLFSRPVVDIAYLIATNPVGNEGDSFMLDHLTFRNVSEIPEPSSLALIVTGLISLSLVMRTRARRK